MNRGVSNNDKYITTLSQFGVGMLLGTSFMLVIPEGIKACLEHNGNVGLNLLIGFLVVYILDRGVQLLMEHPSRFTIFQENDATEIEGIKDLLKSPKRIIVSILKNNVVFALFVHGLSDGIALGTTINNQSLLIIVLIAIVVHKIPAVLSLSSLMISKQRLPKWEALSNLFAFALSTPLGYVVVSAFNLKHSDTMDWIGGNLLLMSGGSLLYASFTAFTDGDAPDHIPLEDIAEEGFFREGSNFIMVDTNAANNATVGEANPSNKSDTSNIEFRNVTAVTPPPVANSKASYQELIYLLLGVLVPVIISFFLSED